MPNQEPMIKVQDVRFRYDPEQPKYAVDGVSLDIRRGEFVAVLGANGCGKSTLGRVAMGIYPATSGKLYYAGEELNLKNAATRFKYAKKAQIIFQDPYASLDPRMTVSSIIEEGMVIHGMYDAKRRQERVYELLELVGLNKEHANRFPHEFSGGQRQRVALGRALVRDPQVFLLDEPLGNLDAKLRDQVRYELKKIQTQLGVTTIYVTHDQEEALTLSDRIAVFNKGYIEQIGTPNEIYNHSKTEFVCNFIGDINRVEAPIAAKMKLAAGQNHFIRLERLHVNKPKRDDEILIDGVVENIEYYGLYIKYYIDVGSQILKAIEKNDGINIYAPGEKVTVAMKPTDVMSYDAQ